MTIKKVAVIGAGLMGSGIAAQFANAGISVELFDVNVEIAEKTIKALEKAAKKPGNAGGAMAALMHAKNIKYIRAGSSIDNTDRLGDCDLIIEAATEDPKIKSIIFKNIDKHRKQGSIVVSNTSTMPLKDLVADQSDALKKDFVIGHFFNPPRHMPLLEIVISPQSDKEKMAHFGSFMRKRLGRDVIFCKDSPGFIGNRIGVFWIETAINEAYKYDLKIEEADALMSKPIGVPNMGVFGLVDFVSLALMPHISESFLSKLSPDDEYCKNHIERDVINKMLEDGYVGKGDKIFK
ncbi:MAG: 3-hydroxyacyl-CoA dehydrogenase family protein, partial [Flavobacteriaceae bacterium]|nr:3-hydroxyacyl-CoA dehydrogenase family protein [Flavobacteriaceae bacterium]